MFWLRTFWPFLALLTPVLSILWPGSIKLTLHKIFFSQKVSQNLWLTPIRFLTVLRLHCSFTLVFHSGMRSWLVFSLFFWKYYYFSDFQISHKSRKSVFSETNRKCMIKNACLNDVWMWESCRYLKKRCLMGSKNVFFGKLFAKMPVYTKQTNFFLVVCRKCTYSSICRRRPLARITLMRICKNHICYEHVFHPEFPFSPFFHSNPPNKQHNLWSFWTLHFFVCLNSYRFSTLV